MFNGLFVGMTIVGLAPMDGVTNEPFRLTQVQLCRPDIIFTEFVSAEGITRGGVKLFQELFYSPEERPIVGQIFGKDPDAFYQAAIILSHLGFDRIDINMGCPAKTVTEHGSGAALIANPALATELINATKSGISDYQKGIKTAFDVAYNQKTKDAISENLAFSKFDPTQDHRQSIPISVKTRVGIQDPSLEVWVEHLLKHDLDFITIHGRTLKQMYSGLADWELIAKAAQIAQGTKTKIWGSGDIKTRAQAQEYGQKYAVDGVLIGRAAMDNPWCFENRVGTSAERFQAMYQHAQNFMKTFPERRFDPLRKIFLAYTSGLPNAKELRSKLIFVSNLEQLSEMKPSFTQASSPILSNKFLV